MSLLQRLRLLVEGATAPVPASSPASKSREVPGPDAEPLLGDEEQALEAYLADIYEAAMDAFEVDEEDVDGILYEVMDTLSGEGAVTALPGEDDAEPSEEEVGELLAQLRTADLKGRVLAELEANSE